MRNSIILFFTFYSLGFLSQETCDELLIQNISLNPLDTQELIIQVDNTSTTELFAYPGFRIYEQGQLIAEEEVFFFGIGGYSVHRLPHSLGVLNAGQFFDFEVELWTGFYDSLHCTYDVPTVPYDDQECTELNINLTLLGGASSQFHVLLVDILGTMILDTLLVDDIGDPIGHVLPTCLVETCYELSIVSEGDPEFPVGMTTFVSVPNAFSIIGSVGTSVAGDMQAIYDFDVFYGCATELGEYSKDDTIPIAIRGNSIVNTWSESLTLSVFDLKGALIEQMELSSNESVQLLFSGPSIIHWVSKAGSMGSLPVYMQE